MDHIPVIAHTRLPRIAPRGPQRRAQWGYDVDDMRQGVRGTVPDAFLRKVHKGVTKALTKADVVTKCTAIESAIEEAASEQWPAGEAKSKARTERRQSVANKDGKNGLSWTTR